MAVTTATNEIVYQSVPENYDTNNDSYNKNTYTIISKVAYLIGVPKEFFDNDYDPPKMEWYEQLEQNPDARIIRNLCRLRTAIEKNFVQIHNQMLYDLKNLHTMPEYIPQDALRALSKDGVEIVKANCKPATYIVDLNTQIKNRIDSCKSIFPIWLKWSYIRELFIMPDGLSEDKIKNGGMAYCKAISRYPYQMYVNWKGIGSGDYGNILYNDKKFVTSLYELHGDIFIDYTKVTDATGYTKSEVYRFLEESDGTDIVVDCENSSPYKLYATLKNLNQQALLQKINKIILFDDPHTISTWTSLEKFIDIPVEHVHNERVTEKKSLVDFRLMVGTFREYHKFNIRSFILLSSDSDYWGMIGAMPELRFFVMIEEEKIGAAFLDKLHENDIHYCFIDDFCTGNSEEIKIEAVLNEVRNELSEHMQINIQQVLERAYIATRANLTTAERKQLYDRYIAKAKLNIDADGNMSVVLGS